MKALAEYQEIIHSCSKCGLCQAVCPIYKITGNDCTVSRGHFIMLRGLIRGDLQMTPKINKYLNLCLKCGKCKSFCPSEIEIIDIINSAKAEYFKKNPLEKWHSLFIKLFVFDFGINFLKLFAKNIKSKKFDKKIVYFGGCSGKIKGNSSVIRLLNACNIEVITPNFDCCGIPFLTRGNVETFNNYQSKIFEITKKYNDYEIVTTCASCETTLKKAGINVKNIYTFLRENNIKIQLKKKISATYHKPCNLQNFADVDWLLNNVENLNYIKMQDFDNCCGLNGLSNLKEYKTLNKLYSPKRKNIEKTKAKKVLTSCFGCEVALNTISLGKYKTYDLIEFLAKNSIKSN